MSLSINSEQILKLPNIDKLLQQTNSKDDYLSEHESDAKARPITTTIDERKRSGYIKNLQSKTDRSRDSIKFKKAVPSSVNLADSSTSFLTNRDGLHLIKHRVPHKTRKVDDSSYKETNPMKYRSTPGDEDYVKIFKQSVCTKEEDEQLECRSKSGKAKMGSSSTPSATASTTSSISQVLVDTLHRPSVKTQGLRSNESLRKTTKKEFGLGCLKPENEVNFMGGLGPCVGNKRSKRYPQRVTNVQKIFRMRTGNYPLFSLTENPRKAHCPVPKVRRSNQKFSKILKNVELADNVDTPIPSKSSIVNCETFDLENPMKLDLQGLDYKETYEKDEQEIEDKREYYNQLLHIKRRLIKLEIERISEEKERKSKYSVPKVFDVDAHFEDEDHTSGGSAKTNKKIPLKVTLSDSLPAYRKPSPQEIPLTVEPEALAQLYRTVTKKENSKVIEKEFKRRVERYYNLWATRKAKERLAAEKKYKQETIDAGNLVMDLGERFFKDFLKDKYQEYLEIFESLPVAHVKRRYPHTLRETKRLRQKLNESKKIIRDKALIKTKVYDSKGIVKNFKEVNISVSEAEPQDQDQQSLSEQSSDDEDDLFVGLTKTDEYQVRGFQFKLGSDPRGLKDRMHKNKADRPLRTCQTRSSWFQKLVPDVSPPTFFQYNTSSLKKRYLPNDPDIELFARQSHPVMDIPIAPIEEHLSNSAPHSYTPQKQVRLKIKKPKYMKVKKFNLTGYMYGARKLKKNRIPLQSSVEVEKKVAFDKFFKQSEGFADQACELRRTKRHERLRYLGLPFDSKKKGESVDDCNISNTESSEWIPDDEEIHQMDLDASIRPISNITMRRSGFDKIREKHHAAVANMPAPKFREPTLRNHPRRPRIREKIPRISQGFSDDSVSVVTKSDTNIETVKGSQKTVSSRAPYDVPRLAPIPPDAVIPANLEIKKAKFAKSFNARYHHDHFDPTDHKVIRVRYRNKLPKINVFDEVASEKVSKQKRPFEKTNPRGENHTERDLSIPQVRYLEEQSELKFRSWDEAENKDDPDVTVMLPVNERTYHSRVKYQDNLVGKSEYIEAIRKMAVKLRRELEKVKRRGNEFAINEKQYAAEVEKEIESINSCVTSLESSICTNFTNDSGSFIMIQDKKVPFEYITKPFVPFEEIDRVRIRAARTDPVDEYNAPYYTVPFAGQKQDQMNLSKPSDKFFTYNERSRVGLRKRLEVQAPDFRNELIGNKRFKAASKLATEWDENYQQELRNRTPIRPFKRKTTMILLREGIRKKFETLHILGQMTEQQIVQKNEVEYANEIARLRNMCQDLFQKWQERHYHASMALIENIKPFYMRSDALKKRYNSLEQKMTKLNMRIVFIEDDWIRRTILQNFHYLIMEEGWRVKHDWIHLREDGTLENFRTSIDNRRIVNIRKRDRDDAWAIKEFYENVYLPNKHPIEIVFPDAQTFNNGTVKLKIRTFICLLELHFSMWILANLQHEFNLFTKQSSKFIEQTTKFVKNRGTNKYFMEDRARQLEQNTRELYGEPLRKSVGSPRLRTIEPLCDVIYVNIIPQNIRNDVKEDCSSLDKLQMIFSFLMDIIGQLDGIPLKIRTAVERKYRKRLDYVKAQSQQACLIEKRIHLALEEIKRNMLPPFKKPPRTGKLPRVFFKKKHVVKKEVKHVISEKNRLFYQAFTESDGEEVQFENAENSDILNSLQDNCIPFYFDHFLRLHDYEPNYDFKTQIEINEGPEEKRLVYKDVLPEVFKHLEMWKAAKKKKMEADIQKTLYLYIDDDN